MDKIQMTTPLVEMDGDEMTRLVWAWVKEKLILPFVDLKTDYYDLSLTNRDTTEDKVTLDAAEATKRYGVAVKCSTITPNAQRMEEYSLHEMWKSPNATIRAALDGTVFRTPILISSVKPAVRTWEKPITVARHAYGDVYKNVEIRPGEEGVCELVFTGKSGAVTRKTVANLNTSGIFQAVHNREDSISSFAHACFRYALATGQDLLFSAKDTISKTYDGAFKAIMEEIFAAYADAFEKAGIRYTYTLIDDAAAKAVCSKGGFIWACKNYDGDVMSDLVSAAFGSIAMMSSVLVSPTGVYEYETAHGTVTDLYRRHLKGEVTSVNPTATIFAWSGALKKRGELDGLPALCTFGDALKDACMDTLNSGLLTGDLLPFAEGDHIRKTDTLTFLDESAQRLKSRLG